MQQLCENLRCQRSVHILHALVIGRLVHRLSDDIHLWYDERCTLQIGFDHLFDNRFRQYKTSQLHFVKDTASAGPDDI